MDCKERLRDCFDEMVVYKDIVERTCRLLALKDWNNYEDNE